MKDGEDGEDWIQCYICHKWCHIECLALEGNNDYICKSYIY